MKFEKSHPWIKFEVELKSAAPLLWLLFGEAKSKCEHLSGVPLMPNVATTLHGIYLAKGIHATTAIEGNTLNEKDVLERIKGKKELPPSQEYLGKEVDNVLGVTNLILDSVEKNGFQPISEEEIKEYNRAVLGDLENDDHVVPGEYARVQVGVPGYRGAPPEEIPHLMDKLCSWLNGKEFKPPSDEYAIPYGIIKAIISHIYIAWIHPFGDGNGRTARLLEVRFLLESDISSSAAHLLSNHYNSTRTEYYRQLDMASKSGGELVPFIAYAVQGFVDQLKQQLKLVKHQQWAIAWLTYVHEQFGDQKSSPKRRQLKLILGLGMQTEPIKQSELTSLTPEIARLYAHKQARTLKRDLNALEEMQLIERTDGKYRATKEQILAFLPRSKRGIRGKQIDEAIEQLEDEIQLGFRF